MVEKDKHRQNTIEGAARKLKVCGHPVRLRLLCAISAREPCVSDLWHCLHEAQPVVSQHLAVLKREGIVSSRVKGNRRIYSVCDPWVRGLIATIEAPTGAPGSR